MLMKLNLKQNALHSLHHAIELIYKSKNQEQKEDRYYNDDDGTVEIHQNGEMHSFIVSEFIVPPNRYKLKFALLHLVQASELILKSYVFDTDQKSFFIQKENRIETIRFYKSLDFVIERNPKLFSEDQINFIKKSKHIRNEIEHFEFKYIEQKLEELCADYLALCFFLSQKFLSINVIEAISWNHLQDKPGSSLNLILDKITSIGKTFTVKAGILWALKNPNEKVLLCLNCNAKIASVSTGFCMGCGTEIDEQASILIEELMNTAKNLKNKSNIDI